MAKHRNVKKTLFFIESAAATEAELEASMEFEPGVQFRNASKIDPAASIEAFDRLAGAVPASYQAVADERAGVGASDAADAPTGGAGTPGAPIVVPRGPIAPPAPATGAAWGANA